jgi:hypothetical protein
MVTLLGGQGVTLHPVVPFTLANDMLHHRGRIPIRIRELRHNGSAGNNSACQKVPRDL